jgi:hypothetical protein
MRHTRNNTSNNGGLAATAPALSPSASAAAAAAAQSAPFHLVSVQNHVASDRNYCSQAAPLGAFPPTRGQAAFVRHAAGDVTAAVADSCCCFKGSGTGGREREARVGGAREVRIGRIESGELRTVLRYVGRRNIGLMSSRGNRLQGGAPRIA